MSNLIIFGEIPMLLCQSDLKIREYDLYNKTSCPPILEVDLEAQIHIGDSFIILINLDEIYISNTEITPQDTEVLFKVFDSYLLHLYYLPFQRFKLVPQFRKLKFKACYQDQLLLIGRDCMVIYDLNLDTPQTPDIYPCGALDACLLVALDNTLYYINLKGQLCSMRKDRIEDYLLFDGKVIEKCIKICAGYEHICILTYDGAVYTYGNSTKGQTGHGEIDLISKSTYKLECFGIVTIKEVACGAWHTLTISENNDLYGWGWNQSLQVGVETPKMLVEPVSINLRKLQNKSHLDVVKIVAGVRHSVAVDTKGNVWTWGSNRFSQMGMTGSSKSLPLLILKKDDTFDVNNIWCGRCCTIIQTKTLQRQ